MKYVFDVDGTLSFDGKVIDIEIVNALKELISKENEVIFASARPIRDLLPIIPQFKSLRLIGANGAITSLNNEIEIIALIEMNDFIYLKKLIQKYNLDYVVDGIWNYSAKVSNDNLIAGQLDPNHLAKRVSMSRIFEPIKVILLDLNNDLHNEFSKDLRTKTSLSIIEQGEKSIDLTAQGINKFTTLKKLGVDDYIAFGNDQNDLDMLNNARKSIWINSKKELLHIGSDFDFVCEAKAQDVATLIRNFV